ncbi:MAG: HEAT repeat domain-containing protein [Cyanobium sp.]
MPASLSALLLTVLVAGFWLTGRRRPRPFLRSTDTLAVAALNRAQIERLRQPEPSGDAAAPEPSESEGIAAVEPPQATPRPAELGRLVPALSPLERRRRLAQLIRLARGSRDERLQAMTMAGAWRQRELLPLLRRGLRDPDPAVMAAAAAAIDRFRGRPTPESAVAAAGEQPSPHSPRPAVQRRSFAGRPSTAAGG